ncbi:hypothetical protein BKA83DRAFT_1762801 [Pisolithus microcarpus]|nr:hypothetical protein BKA83DRAFT_1762801 [Pisolithus microcarpus]
MVSAKKRVVIFMVILTQSAPSIRLFRDQGTQKDGLVRFQRARRPFAHSFPNMFIYLNRGVLISLSERNRVSILCRKGG